MFFKKTIIITLVSLILVLPCYSTLQAQDYGLEEAKKIQGVAKEEPRDFVARAINYTLGLIGVILLVLIIYGGFTYATSAGNEKRIETAKKILIYAIIGTIIIAMSWLISYFVLQAITSAPKPEEEKITPEKEKEKLVEEEKSKKEKEEEYLLDFPESGQEIKAKLVPEGEPCLSGPDIDDKDNARLYAGVCDNGLSCDPEKKICVKTCAEAGESYIRLLTGDEIGCCETKTSRKLYRNTTTETCEKPKL